MDGWTGRERQGKGRQGKKLVRTLPQIVRESKRMTIIPKDMGSERPIRELIIYLLGGHYCLMP